MASVLGVGWAKTGTTTLGECLKILGYRHETKRLDLVPEWHRDDHARLMAIAHEWDSFEDWPWLLMCRGFNADFPECKFILTDRDPQAWLTSRRALVDRQSPGVLAEHIPIRRALYGPPFPDVTDEQVVERSLRHQREVRDYFTHRPGKLLVVNWAEGDGWQELCGLLGHPVPDLPFPHASKGVYKLKTAEARGIQRIRTRLARFSGPLCVWTDARNNSSGWSSKRSRRGFWKKLKVAKKLATSQEMRARCLLPR